MPGNVFKSTFRDAGLGVPRRLPLGELMLLVTLFAAVFQALSLIQVPGEGVLCIGIFTLGVALCQAMMFGGQRPRDASMIAGTILCPAMFLIYVLVFRFQYPGEGRSISAFICSLTLSILLGTILGYFIGLFVAGWFYAFDYCRFRLTGAPRRSHETQVKIAPSSDQSEIDPSAKSTAASANKPTWLTRVASHFWPIRPSQPMRGAIGAFLNSLVCCLIFAPAIQLGQLGYWNIPCIFVFGVTAAFLTGMFQLPWSCTAISVAVSVVACQWEISRLQQLAYDLFVDHNLKERNIAFVSFLLTCLAIAIPASAAALAGWLKLAFNRYSSATKSATRRRARWGLLTLSVAVGLLAPLAYKIALDAFCNSPRMSIARKITRDDGSIYFSPSSPSLTGWPTSYGIHVKKDTRLSLADYLAAYPETGSTTHIGIDDNDLDDSSLAPLDGARIPHLDLAGSPTDHIFDNIKDLSVGNMSWYDFSERMKIGDNSLVQLARMPGMQTTLVSFTAASASVTDIQPLEKLKTLQHISFFNCPVENVRFAVQMPGITNAEFRDCPITDADLKQIIAAMPNIQALELRGTRITDGGLEELAKLKQLCNLNLSNTKITDEGLRHLENIPALGFLFLQESKVSEAASEALAKKRGIDIDWDNEQPKSRP